MFKAFKWAPAICLIATTAFAEADIKMVSSGGTYSDLCILAAESPNSFKLQMRANGLESGKLMCNGEPVKVFLTHNLKQGKSVSAGNNVLKAADGKLFTQLCIKGASGEMDWTDIKAALPQNLDPENVLCNGERLQSFMQKHQS